MSDVVISVENISKSYQLGAIGTGTFYGDLQRWWAKQRGLPDPHLKIGKKDHGNRDGETVWALKDIDFQVRQGQTVGIIGRNGAGKSTLLKILSRVTAPTSGEVKIKGQIASLLEVGTGFHPELTGRENIYLNGAIMGMSRSEVVRRFDEIVDFSGTEQYIDTPVKRYSSGMYVRLAFAVAAHLQPEILIVDEVLAVGDVEFQKKCIGKMENVAEEGRTVIIVSHSMSTVKALCSNGILLDRGKIALIGPVDEVINKYISADQVDVAKKVVEDKDHLGGVKQIRVKHIWLLNGVMDSFSVFWRQPITISLDIEVLEQVKDVAFGAGIRAIDGTKIFTVHHDDKGDHSLWTFEPGNYSIEFTLQNDLRPGLYKLHIGADREHMMLNNILALDVVTLEVIDHTEQGTTPLASNDGYINGNSTWRVPECLTKRL